MQIYEALIEDHRKVQELLDRLLAVGENEDEMRHQLVADIRDELVPHSRAEEAVFYNSVRSLNQANELVWHGYEEHMAAEMQLRTLQAADKVDVEWERVARKLKTALDHHIQDEEERIIPLARNLFTPEEAERMCEAFEAMKPKVKEGSFLKSTMELIANIMPARLKSPFKDYKPAYKEEP
jgi:hemerythrin superfamily protein